jgi:hypothetical protein
MVHRSTKSTYPAFCTEWLSSVDQYSIFYLLDHGWEGCWFFVASISMMKCKSGYFYLGSLKFTLKCYYELVLLFKLADGNYFDIKLSEWKVSN